MGRPRADVRPDSGLTPSEEILDAAAELFTTRGYTATSTRAIAERAGMRQASMYHYFGGKEDMLAALLESTVAPSLALAKEIVAREDLSAEARLWALCHADAALLCKGPHNLGALYLLPEAKAERFAAFHEMRSRLRELYRRLTVAVSPARADLIFGLVESVILIPRDDAEILPAAVADGALKLAGLTQEQIDRVRPVVP